MPCTGFAIRRRGLSAITTMPVKRATKPQGIPRPPSIGESTFDLHCRVYGLNPEREWRFHPERKWRFDFAWPSLMLAVEVEGGTWKVGRHQTGKGFAADCEKYNAAAILGWRVLRYTTDMVESNEAIDCVRLLTTA